MKTTDHDWYYDKARFNEPESFIPKDKCIIGADNLWIIAIGILAAISLVK